MAILLYVDPGSGTFIWELIISFFVGTVFYFSKFKGLILLRFQRRRGRRAATRNPFGENQTPLGVTQVDSPEDR
jgi:hypothetical protein